MEPSDPDKGDSIGLEPSPHQRQQEELEGLMGMVDDGKFTLSSFEFL